MENRTKENEGGGIKRKSKKVYGKKNERFENRKGKEEMKVQKVNRIRTEKR